MIVDIADKILVETALTTGIIIGMALVSMSGMVLNVTCKNCLKHRKGEENTK